MGKVDMAERKTTGYEGDIPGIELTFYPIWPDPIQIMLNGLAVDQPTGMKYNPSSQEFNRFLDL
jgi:hypothetical protein